MSNTPNIAIVVATFNDHITNKLLQGALDELNTQQIAEEHITVVHVPGAVEIAYTAQRLARTQKFDAIITLGAVIYGETDHYHYVCEQVNNGCQRVMLDESIPVIFGVMTVRTQAHADARSGGEKGNMGAEAAETALKMIAVTRKIDQLT